MRSHTRLGPSVGELIGSRSLRRAALAMAVVLGTALPSRGDLEVVAPVVSITPGTSGAFDILIENTNAAGGASYDVSSETIQLELGGGISGLSFTDVTINTVTPYVFVDSGTNHGGGPF